MAGPYEVDRVDTSAGPLAITFIGHGTLMFEFNGKTIHVDPWTKVGDYSQLPKADLILITHHHQDHLDETALKAIRKSNTQMVVSQMVADKIGEGLVMKNGDVRIVLDIKIEAVPAYNQVHKRDNGQFFHPPGEGNGYVLSFGDKRVYVAGDTENIPEMKKLGPIDIAFLPMNLPYTMTPEMAADAARMVKPKILYPYHFGKTNTSILTDLLKNEENMEVRIRDMQ